MAAYQFCHFGVSKISGWQGMVNDRNIVVAYHALASNGGAGIT